MTAHFAVLGAGLMGRLLAHQLARRGHAVDLYERGPADGSSSAAHVAAAMLAPLAESVTSEPLVVHLGLASLRRWPELLALLPEPVFFQQNGTLILWHAQDRDQAHWFSTRLQEVDPELRKDQVRELRAGEIENLEPALGQRFSRALYLEGEAQLDNRGLLEGLLRALEASGVRLHWYTELSPERAQGDFIVDCRGLGARPDWQALRGVRGEVVRVHSPEVELRRPIRLLHPRYPIYIAPKPGGVYVIGATQIEAEDHSPVSVRSALELLSALYSVHPAFGEARILETAVQCRPTLPDHLPEIRWDGRRLLQINGLYRHGYLIAPAVLDAALALIEWLLEDGRGGWESWHEYQSWAPIYRLSQPV